MTQYLIKYVYKILVGYKILLSLRNKNYKYEV